MILNRPSDGSAPVLYCLWRTLKSLGNMDESRLIALCGPKSLDGDADGAKRTRETLTRWKQMGLFRGDETSGKVQLVTPFDKIDEKGDLQLRDFRKEVRRLVFREENNIELIKDEPEKGADFTFALSWLLTIDVYSMQLKSFPAVQEIENSQVEPVGEDRTKYVFQNDTRWSGFKDWATFLGFGWDPTNLRAATFQLDPTEAVEDELAETFADDEELNFGGFVQRLNQRLPVLNGGTYSIKAKKRAKPEWRTYGDHEVPPALTRALLRLTESGLLNLESKADADQWHLLGGDHKRLESVSHVRFNQA